MVSTARLWEYFIYVYMFGKDLQHICDFQLECFFFRLQSEHVFFSPFLVAVMSRFTRSRCSFLRRRAMNLSLHETDP
jgi:hypothetical protein